MSRLNVISTVGNSYSEAINVVGTDTMTLDEVINKNNQIAFNNLVQEINKNGPGVYEIFYERPNYEFNHGYADCFTIMVGNDAFTDGKFDPTAVNFHNPGSSPSPDLQYIDNAFKEANGGRIEQLAYNSPSEPTNGAVDVHITVEGANMYQNNPFDRSDYSSTSANFMKDFINNCDLNKDNVSFSGFSAYDTKAIKSAIQYSSDTGAQDFIIYSLEPAQDAYEKRVNLSPEEKQVIKDNNLTIIDIHNSHDMHINSHAQGDQDNEDLHYIEVIVTAKDESGKEVTGHGWVNQIFSGGMSSEDFDWTDLPKLFKTDGNDGIIELEYEIVEHIPGEEDRILTPEEMNALVSRKSETVKSNSEYTNMLYFKINKLLISSGILDQKSISLPNGSTTSSPQINIDTYNRLFYELYMLSCKLIIEMKAINYAAKKYDELDIDLKNKV